MIEDCVTAIVCIVLAGAIVILFLFALFSVLDAA